MKHAKKSLAILMSIVLLLTAVSFSTFAADGTTKWSSDFEYIIEKGQATVVGYENHLWEDDIYPVFELAIPEKLDGYTVTKIASEAIDTSDGVRTITIPKTVTEIEPGAFYSRSSDSAFSKFAVDKANPAFTAEDGVLFNKDKTELICCPSDTTNLVYHIPNSVVSIRDGAFIDNNDLYHIVIPTSVKHIGEYAFPYVRVYYNGTSRQWNQVEVGENNYAFEEDDMFYCLSEYGYCGIIDSGYCGDNAQWILFEDGILSIYGTGRMNDWYDESYPTWEEHKNNINAVAIDEGITYIGAYAFWKANELYTFIIPSTVTKIGHGAFTTYNDETFEKLVIFQGSPDMWNNIDVADGNDELFTDWLVWIDEVGYTSIENFIIIADEDTVDYGNSAHIYATADYMPFGAIIEWDVSNGNFLVDVSGSTQICTATSDNSGETTFYIVVDSLFGYGFLDENYEPIAESISINSNAGIFQIIAYFFRELFNLFLSIFI